MNTIIEVIAYIAIGYFVVIPALLYILSRTPSFIEEGGQKNGYSNGAKGENEEYRKAA